MSVARPSGYPLDQPIWTALTTRQQGFAEGVALALRYPPAVGPFADFSDMSPRAFAALGALMSGSEMAVLFTPEAVVAPAEFKLLLAKTLEQMTGTPRECSLPGAEPVLLGAKDVPEMMALAELTKPGPFGMRTHELYLRREGPRMRTVGQRRSDLELVCAKLGRLRVGEIKRSQFTNVLDFIADNNGPVRSDRCRSALQALAQAVLTLS